MKLFYYYYFRFYTEILPDDEPHATTVFTLSLSESFPVCFIIQKSFEYYSCISFTEWEMIAMVLPIFVFNYFYFMKSGRAERIIQQKPKVFNSTVLSVILVILFFIVTASVLFLHKDFVNGLLGIKC